MTKHPKRLERGLMELRTTSRGRRAFFTQKGLSTLRRLVLDRRAINPERFAHLRRELGLDGRMDPGAELPFDLSVTRGLAQPCAAG
jgi:hypothetical protein